jgi:hypothetical protein
VLSVLVLRDESVLLRVPVQPLGPSAGPIDEAALARLSDLLALGANPKRLRVLLELARGEDLRFSDVLRIVTNPKLARDCLAPLVQAGLVDHGERGSAYRVSKRGLAASLALTVTLGEILGVLERELEVAGP